MQHSASDIPYFTFSNGVRIPAIGYGTSRSGDNLELALETAILCGYRQIDTAYFYGNEQIIGKVIKKLSKEGKISRQELFITTKLHSQFYHFEDVEPALRLQLENLQLDYVDLYLIHTPWGVKKVDNDKLPMDNGLIVPDAVDHLETWKALENVYKKNLTRSIGLSNFFSSQILNIYEKSSVKPHNLQLACHAYWPQENLHALCNKLNIVMTAYGPLGSPAYYSTSKVAKQLPPDNIKRPVLLDDETVKEIASKYNKTSPQVRFTIFQPSSLVSVLVTCLENLATNKTTGAPVKPRCMLPKLLSNVHGNLVASTYEYACGCVQACRSICCILHSDCFAISDIRVTNILQAFSKHENILLKWLIQRGINVIPKSVTERRIKENIDIFDFNINENDFEKLSNLPIRHRLYGVMDSLFMNHPQFIHGEEY